MFMLLHIGDENCYETCVVTASFDKLEEFDNANGKDWVPHIKCMEHYFLANDIKDANK